MVEIVYNYQRQERIFSQQEKNIRQEFFQAVQTIRAQLTQEEIRRHLQEGTITALLARVEGLGATVAEGAAVAYFASGQDVATFLRENIGAAISFDRTNEQAVGFLRANRLELIREIDGNTRQAIQAELIQGSIDGINPRQTARRIRDTIGLNTRMQAAVNNYRRLLMAGQDGRPSGEALQRMLRDARFDRTVRNAIRESRALSTDQIDRMVARYQQRFINHRATNIARTETLKALNAGSHNMFDQAIANGNINPDEIVREWRSARDARVRDAHSASRVLAFHGVCQDMHVDQ